MKKAFSTSWVRSKQPRKQRKYRANVPSHTKRKFMSIHLDKALREKYKRRSFPVVIGDKVKVIVGQFKAKEGKVEAVDKRRTKVFITGIDRSKRDGGKSKYPFQPSNLMILELNLKDSKRKTALERNINTEKKGVAEKIDKPKAERPKEVKEVKEVKKNNVVKEFKQKVEQ